MSDKRLNELLHEGEQLRWAGKSQVTKALDADNRKSALWTVGLAGVLTLLLILLYSLSLKNNGDSPRTGIIVFILAIGAAVGLGPFNTFRKVKKVIYAVTSERIIVSVDADKSFDLPLDKADTVMKVTGQDGYTSLLIGTPTGKTKMNKLRTNAINGVRTEEGETIVLYPVFYNIPDADKVIELIKG